MRNLALILEFTATEGKIISPVTLITVFLELFNMQECAFGTFLSTLWASPKIDVHTEVKYGCRKSYVYSRQTESTCISRSKNGSDEITTIIPVFSGSVD
jgi:hypothetical protein